jgi:hypothetical protein
MTRIRPGRSVRNSFPSGANASAQGTCNPVATVSATTFTGEGLGAADLGEGDVLEVLGPDVEQLTSIRAKNRTVARSQPFGLPTNLITSLFLVGVSHSTLGAQLTPTTRLGGSVDRGRSICEVLPRRTVPRPRHAVNDRKDNQHALQWSRPPPISGA